jgi:protein SCO1/2
MRTTNRKLPSPFGRGAGGEGFGGQRLVDFEKSLRSLASRPHPNPLPKGEGTCHPHIAAFLLAMCLASTCAAQVTAPSALKKMGFDQRLNEQVPLDLTFTDETGKAVRLGEYFGEKPVILVLAYYRCPMLCTLVLNGLTQALRDMPFTIGKEFNVVTVSFDPRETPDLAAAKKKTYMTSYGRPGADDGWHFLTGKQDAIEKLTKAVGFRYEYNAKEDLYNHASGIMVLTPRGKISRYFFNISFPARDLRLGLVEASADKIGSPADEILLYCFHYDPATGKYSASILNFVRLGGLLTVVGLIGLVWFLLRWEGRKRAGGGGP